MKNLIMSLLVFALSVQAYGAQRSFPQNASKEEFRKWQTETRALLSGILYNGQPPAPVFLDPSFGEEEVRENYRLVQVSFHDRPSHVTTGWLARPLEPTAKKLPVVIALHGHNGDARMTFDPQSMYDYGALFARQGYIVFALDLDHKYIDYSPTDFGYGLILPKNVPFPGMGQRVWMVKRGIDFLATLPDADLDRIGIVGLSNGGLTAMFVAAMEPRIKIAAAAGSLIMHDRMWHRELIHCRCQHLERMDGALDYYDVFALIAPRPLIVQNGEEDRIFPINSARKAFTFVQRAYAIAGASDNVIHDVHDGAHEFRAEVPLAWFTARLPLPKEK